MPPSEPPDRNEVANSIDRFIAAVEEGFDVFRSPFYHRGVHLPGGASEDPPGRGRDPALDEACSRRWTAIRDAIEEVRRSGEALAGDLARLAFEPTAVVTVLAATENLRRCFPDLRATWTGLTVQLKTMALRLRVEETPEELQGTDATAVQGGKGTSRGERRKRIRGKLALRKLLTPDYQVGEGRLQRFIEGLRKAGNAGTEGRRLWVYRDAALSAAPTVFPRRPKKCPKCGAESACASCGRCPACSGGPCSCDDAPGLEGNFIA